MIPAEDTGKAPDLKLWRLLLALALPPISSARKVRSFPPDHHEESCSRTGAGRAVPTLR